jgi:hypothetical protein
MKLTNYEKPFIHFSFFLILIVPYLKNDSISTFNPSLRTYTTHRLDTAPPVIDGKLDDQCWQNEYWDGDFTQWIPKEGANHQKKQHLTSFTTIRTVCSYPGA